MLLFSFPAQQSLGDRMAGKGELCSGKWEWRYFPDGESYVRIDSDVKEKQAAIVCGLDNPDDKLMPLLLLARTLKDLGVKRLILIAPYLGYMRQDTQFQPGEALSAKIFAGLLSDYVDGLITVDPHLHRFKRLEEVYTIPCQCLSAGSLMAEWVMDHALNALLIGPDSESEQWVKTVAEHAQTDYLILKKQRQGDRNVTITVPEIGASPERTIVILDDVISTGNTLIEVVQQVKAQGYKKTICLATHGIFAEEAYARLQQAGAAEIITSNTIPHASNAMDVSGLFCDVLTELQQSEAV